MVQSMLIKSLKGATAATLVFGLGMLGASPALAASARKHVAGGIDAAAIPQAKVFGKTPARTPETVSFIFKINGSGGLAQLETQADSGFGSGMSVAAFAAQYGQPASNIQALQSYLAGYGIRSTAYANNLDVSATGRAGAFDKALSVTQRQYKTPAGHSHAGSAPIPAQSFHGVSSEPSLPASIAQNLVAILGLTNYAPSVSNAAHVSSTLAANTKPGSGGESACEKFSGLPDDCNLPSNFESNYGLDQLYSTGADGSGQTLGIITLATVDPGAPQYFWRNIANVRRTGSLSYDNVDGGAGAPSYDAGTGETDLDIEQSGAIAPGANIVVYTAPNTDSGFIDAFFTAATQDSAGSVSCSWGEAETLIQAAQAEGAEPSGYITAYDEALLEFDAQGQASFVASGDGGAYDAYGEFPGTDQPTNLSVDNPSDSPYTTAAGGTTLPWSATLTSSTSSATARVDVRQQRIWGWDYLWRPIAILTGTDLLTAAESAIAGSGGGFSVVEPEPSYQQDVSGTSSYSAVPWLTPTDYTTEYGPSLPIAWTLNPHPPTISGSGSGRAMPDLAADADPYSGYIEYAPSDAGQDGIASPTQPGWGGTSFVAPELNGSAAVIDSYLGGRTGFWNPSIYAFAASASSPFTPLGTSGTSNDNLYYTGTPGAQFDLGAGLGIPDLSKLAADFKSAP
jgi:subtilase family serine protease